MFTKLVRLGRDAELRYTPSNKAVTSLACVYDVGFGENKKSQWIDVSLWGKQAEALAPYLTKGKQIVVCADDIEIEQYNKNDGTVGVKLKGRAINIDLTSGGQQQQPQKQPQQPQQQPQQPQQQGGFQQQASNGQQQPQQQKVNPQEPTIDFDDDVPF